MKKSHRWYVDSLADHMRVINNRGWAVFSENFLGPRYSVSAGNGVIPDVLAIKKSYAKPCIRICEVKVTEEDFNKCVKTGKWNSYMQSCNQFFFATPAGLVKKEQIPDGIGWMVHTDNGWSTVVGAKYRSDGYLSEQDLLSLIFAEQRYRQNVRDAEDNMRSMRNFRGSVDRHRFAENISQMLKRCEDAADEHKRAAANYHTMRSKIVAALGIEEDVHDYELEQALIAQLELGCNSSTKEVLASIGRYLIGLSVGHGSIGQLKRTIDQQE